MYGTLAKEKQKFSMNVAVADFFHAPEIEEVDLEGYSGKTGELIRVKARDDVQVTRVAVLISDAAGNEIERGDAEKESGLGWKFTATSDVGSGEATVVVTVNDLE